MKTPPFELQMPNNLAEAMEVAGRFIAAGEEFDWIAGGTDLIPNYKWHLNPKPNVISLANISELNQLTRTHIGAMVRLQDLTENEEMHPLLATAAGSIASVMIRRSATVGGNICLDTRCFWYNQSEDWRQSIDWCHKCDCGTEADCRVIQNQNDLCVATYQADLAPALICLNATIHLASPNGLREMPLSDFFELDGMKKNVLNRGEIVTHITLLEDSYSLIGAYHKLSQRETWDFPEAGIAATWDGKSLSSLKIASTGIESIPRDHSEQVEAAIESWNGSQSIDELSESVRKSVKPVNNTGFQPSYRRKMVKVLTRRSLKQLGIK